MVPHSIQRCRDSILRDEVFYLSHRKRLAVEPNEVIDLVSRQLSPAGSLSPGLSRESFFDLVDFNRDAGKLSLACVTHFSQRVFGLLNEQVHDAPRRCHRHSLHTATQKLRRFLYAQPMPGLSAATGSKPASQLRSAV